MKLPNINRGRELILVLSVTLLLGLFVLAGNFLIRFNLEKIKTRFQHYVEEESRIQIDIQKIRANIFSFILFKDIVIFHPDSGVYSQVRSARVRYKIGDFLFRNLKPVESIDTIVFSGLELQADVNELEKLFSGEGTNGLPSFAGLEGIRFVLNDSQIVLRSGQEEIALEKFNLIANVESSNRLKGRIDLEFSGKAGDRAVAFDLSSFFTLDMAPLMVWTRNQVKRISAGPYSFGHLNFNLESDFTTHAVRNLRLDNSFFLDAVVDGRVPRQVKCEFRKFDLFSLSGFPAFLDGTFRLNVSDKTIRFDSDLKMEDKAGSLQAELKIRNNRIENCYYEAGGTRKIDLRHAPDSSEVQGFLDNINVAGNPLSGTFTLQNVPEGSQLYIRDLKADDQNLLNNYRISFLREKTGYRIRTPDSILSGFLSFLDPASSFMSVNVSFLQWGRVFPEKKIHLSGKLDLKVPEIKFSRAALYRENRVLLENCFFRYDFFRGRLAYSASPGDGKISGTARLRSGNLNLSMFLNLQSKSHQADLYVRRDGNRTRYSMTWDELIRATGHITDGSDFRVKIEALKDRSRGKRNVLGGSGYIYGNLTKPDRIKGYGNFTLDNHVSDIFYIPRAGLNFLLRDKGEVLYKFFLTDRNGKKNNGTGELVLGKTVELRGLFLDTLEFNGALGKKERPFLISLNKFDLSFLQPFFRKPLGCLSLQGTSDVNLQIRFPEDFLYGMSGFSVEGEGRVAVNKFSWNKSPPLSFSMAGKYNNKMLDIPRAQMKFPVGQLVFLNTVLLPGQESMIFSSVAEYDVNLKKNRYSGTVTLTGKSSEDKLECKADFMRTILNKQSIARFDQYFKWDKKSGSVKVFSSRGGFQGDWDLKIKPFFSAENIKLDYFASQGEKVFSVYGFVTSKEMDLSVPLWGFDLREMKKIAPFVRRARGSVTGKINLKGDPADPGFFGELNIDCQRLQLNDWFRDIRDLSGSVVFGGDSADLERITAYNQNNLMVVQGSVDLDRYAIQGMRLQVSNDYWQVKRKSDIQGEVSARCEIGLTEEGYVEFIGLVKLRDIEATFPFSDADPYNTNRPPLVFDLRILAENNVWYFNRDKGMEGPLQPGSYLELEGAFGHYKITDHQVRGRIRTVENKAKAEYLGTPFTVSKLELIFAEEYDTELPFVNGEAYAEIKTADGDLEIFLEVEGLLDDQLIPDVYSQPALTKREIVQYLGYGQLYDTLIVSIGEENTSVDIPNSSESELDRLLLAGMLTYVDQEYQAVLIKPLEQRLRQALSLDRVQIKPQISRNVIEKGMQASSGQGVVFNPFRDTLNNTQVVLGKYLTDYLFLEYILTVRGEDYFENSQALTTTHQLGLELDLDSLSFEWKMQPRRLNQAYYNEDIHNLQIKWQQSF